MRRVRPFERRRCGGASQFVRLIAAALWPIMPANARRPGTLIPVRFDPPGFGDGSGPTHTPRDSDAMPTTIRRDTGRFPA